MLIHDEFRISGFEDYQKPQAPRYLLSHLDIDPCLLAETGTTDVFTIPICHLPLSQRQLNGRENSLQVTACLTWWAVSVVAQKPVNITFCCTCRARTPAAEGVN